MSDTSQKDDFSIRIDAQGWKLDLTAEEIAGAKMLIQELERVPHALNPPKPGFIEVTSRVQDLLNGLNAQDCLEGIALIYGRDRILSHVTMWTLAAFLTHAARYHSPVEFAITCAFMRDIGQTEEV